MKQLRKHLNVANVISCIALFVALSGAAYAAKATLGNKAVKTRNLANGSVSTLKLRSGAVTTLKLRNGAVTGVKIAPGAVGSTQIANGAVRSSALGGGVVTEGKIKNGAVSQAKLSTSFNAQLLKNMQYVVKIGVSNSEPKSETAQCPSGKEVIGGGARLLGANTQLALTESSPVVNGGGKWSAAAVEINPEAGDWSIEVIAVCAEI
ncbi:MAG TPA: hypothetical protein VIS95_07940 [Solirubrobacterales bacterium]